MGRNSVVLHTPTFEMRLSGNIDERNHENYVIAIKENCQNIHTH